MKKLILTGLFLIALISGIVFASTIEAQVKIHKGWNLIYGFANPSQLSGHLEESNIKAIYVFIPTVQEYAQVYPNPDNGKIDLLGDGYLIKTSMWVYSDKTVEGSLNGVLNADEYMLEEPLPIKYWNEHKLYKGWNFIGILPDMIDKGLEDVRGKCDIEKAYFYNAEEDEAEHWKKLPTDYKLSKDILLLGIVMKVSNDCTMGETTAGISPPPSIPN